MILENYINLIQEACIRANGNRRVRTFILTNEELMSCLSHLTYVGAYWWEAEPSFGYYDSQARSTLIMAYRQTEELVWFGVMEASGHQVSPGRAWYALQPWTQNMRAKTRLDKLNRWVATNKKSLMPVYLGSDITKGKFLIEHLMEIGAPEERDIYEICNWLPRPDRMGKQSAYERSQV